MTHRCTIVKYDPARHLAYCVKSYVESVHAQLYKDIPWSIAKQPLHDDAKAILTPDKTVMVAHDDGDPDWLWGWCSVSARGDTARVHAVYVNYMRRRRGLARDLLALAIAEVTYVGDWPKCYQFQHDTRAWKKLAASIDCLRDATHNPWCGRT